MGGRGGYVCGEEVSGVESEVLRPHAGERVLERLEEELEDGWRGVFREMEVGRGSWVSGEE